MHARARARTHTRTRTHTHTHDNTRVFRSGEIARSGRCRAGTGWVGGRPAPSSSPIACSIHTRFTRSVFIITILSIARSILFPLRGVAWSRQLLPSLGGTPGANSLSPACWRRLVSSLGVAVTASIVMPRYIRRRRRRRRHHRGRAPLARRVAPPGPAAAAGYYYLAGGGEVCTCVLVRACVRVRVFLCQRA